MNIIFNELCQQRVKYDVHTTSKIKSIHAIFYHILFLLLIYPQFYWNYFVIRSNTIRRAWVGLLGHDSSILTGCA